MPLLVLFGLLLFVNCGSVLAEEERGYFSQAWQTEEGLPDNAVNDVTQTKDGYIWLATLKGLVRFDGLQFRTFTPSNTPGLRSAQVRRLLLGEDGTLWIAAGSGGVSALANGKFTSFESAGANIREAVTDALRILPDGSLWVATWGSSVLHLERGKIHTVRQEENAANHFNQWIGGIGGRLELLSGNAILALNDGKWRPSFSSAGDNLCAAPRAAGGYWLAAGRGLHIYEHGRMGPEVAALPGSPPIRAMLEDHRGALWLGTEGAGLFRWAEGKFTLVDTSHASIRALFEDRERNIWVGTEGGGLNKLRQRQVEVRDRAAGLASDVVLSICEDRAGDIWCLTQGGAVSQWRRGDAVSRPVAMPSLAKAIAICATGDGSLWIGTDGNGLLRLQEGVTTNFATKDGLTNDYVSMMGTGRRGELLVGTMDGLSRFDGEKFVVVAPNGALSGGVRALAEDGAGRLWVGSGDGDLHCFTSDSHRVYSRTQGLPGAVIRCLLPMDDGSLWLGTDGAGLGRWQEGSFTWWTKQQGLWDDSITQLQNDARGAFWCGSPRGIFRVKEEALRNFAAGRTRSLESTYFGRSDGLANFRYASEFHPRSLRAQDGRLFFATQKGVVVLDPKSLESNPYSPNVVIEEMRVNERPLSLSPGSPDPELGPGVQSVEFAFTALSFTAPDKVRIRYRMEGLDVDWHEAREERRASYFHLTPGSYRMQVIAANGDGVWNSTGCSVSFRVLAPFWQKPWFLALGLLAFGAVTAGLARWISLVRMRRQLRRVAQRHAVEKERTRIANDLHDELGASLTQVALLSELAQQELSEPQQAASRIAAIRAASHDMARALDEIVWSVSPRNDDLEHLVGYLSQFSNEYLRTAGIACRQEVPVFTPPRPLSEEVRHNVFLSVKEALHNVVQHARASEVRLVIQLAQDSLEILIQDNGCGFAGPATTPVVESGNGVANLRDRLRSLGGVCEIRSAPGQGTQVHFRVPLKMK